MHLNNFPVEMSIASILPEDNEHKRAKLVPQQTSGDDGRKDSRRTTHGPSDENVFLSIHTLGSVGENASISLHCRVEARRAGTNQTSNSAQTTVHLAEVLFQGVRVIIRVLIL